MSLDFRLAACLFGHMDHRDYDTWMDRPEPVRSRRATTSERVPEGLRRQRRVTPVEPVLAPVASDSRRP